MVQENHVDAIISELETKLADAKKLKKAGVKIVEPSDESQSSEATQKAIESKKVFAALCAGIERERYRLTAENCVRLGDTVFNEVSLIESVDAALKSVYENYIKLC